MNRLIWVDNQLVWEIQPRPAPRRIRIRFLLNEFKGTRLKTAIMTLGGKIESNASGALWASFDVPNSQRPSKYRAHVLGRVDALANS